MRKIINLKGDKFGVLMIISIVLILLIQFSVNAQDTEPLDLTVKQGRDLVITMLAKNILNSAFLGANCTVDIFNKTNNKILDDGITTDVGEGLHRFTINNSITNTIGDYYGFVLCTGNNLTDIGPFEFRVVSLTIKEEIDIAENVIIKKVDDAEESIEDTIKDELMETKTFMANLFNFIRSDFFKGLFFGIVLFVMLVIIIFIRGFRGKRKNTNEAIESGFNG